MLLGKYSGGSSARDFVIALDSIHRFLCCELLRCWVPEGVPASDRNQGFGVTEQVLEAAGLRPLRSLHELLIISSL